MFSQQNLPLHILYVQVSVVEAVSRWGEVAISVLSRVCDTHAYKCVGLVKALGLAYCCRRGFMRVKHCAHTY